MTIPQALVAAILLAWLLTSRIRRAAVHWRSLEAQGEQRRDDFEARAHEAMLAAERDDRATARLLRDVFAEEPRWGRMTHPAVQAKDDGEAAERLFMECGYFDDFHHRWSQA